MKFYKSHEPLEVGSIVRNSGNGARLMWVASITSGWAVLTSYGKTDGKGNLIKAIRPRSIVKEIAKYDFEEWRGRKFTAHAYCDSSGPYSHYMYYHVKVVA